MIVCQIERKLRIMTKTKKSKASQADGMLAEYRFDYSNACPNRFATEVEDRRVVVFLDPDVADVFQTSEAVNTILRSLITATPKAKPHKSGLEPANTQRRT